jgi:hypothetical protein
MVMKVSFLFGPSLLLYKLFNASLIEAFRFASSAAKLSTTARLAVEILGFGNVLCIVCFLGGGARPGPASVAAFRFFDLVGAASLRASILTRISVSSSSEEGLSVRTSVLLKYLVEHCGHSSKGGVVSGLSLSPDEGGVDEEEEDETVLNPALEKTHPQVQRNWKG